MYSIEETDYGFRLVFGGSITKNEIWRCSKDLRDAIDSRGRSWSLLLDLREMAVLPQESRDAMVKIQRVSPGLGMMRLSVVLDDPVIRIQFQRIGQESGISHMERYMDASSLPNWEQIGLNWVRAGIDPNT